MKKSYLIIISIISILIVLLLPIQVFAGEAVVVNTSTGKLYLRNGPGSSSYNGVVRQGETLTTYESHGRFIHVQTADGRWGWIAKNKLADTSSGWVKIEIQHEDVYLWTNSYGDDYITIIPINTNIKINYSSANDDKYLVYYNGYYGWIDAEYVE